MSSSDWRLRRITSPAVCEITGLTYRQLDRYCEAGLIPGKAQIGAGTHREFTLAELVACHVVASLNRLGIRSLEQLRAVAEYIALSAGSADDVDSSLCIDHQHAVLRHFR